MPAQPRDLTSAPQLQAEAENTRLFHESHLREEWMSASAEITCLLLIDEGEDPLQVIGRRVLEIAAADAVNVVLPAGDGRRLVVEVAAGAGADQLVGLGYPLVGTVCEAVFDTGKALLIPDMADEHHLSVHLNDVVRVGVFPL